MEEDACGVFETAVLRIILISMMSLSASIQFVNSYKTVYPNADTKQELA